MAQNIVFKISADTSNFDAGMKKTGVEVDAVNKKTKQATAEVGQFQKALGNIGGMVAGAFAVSSIIAFGKEVAKTRAEIESLTTRIADIKGGQEAGNKAMDELRQTANQLGIEFKELASNYASFVGGAKASGMEITKAEKIFKSMTIAIKGSGANAETAKRAFTALTQMIGKGCHAKGTLIRLYDGTSKVVEDIRVGNVLISPCGEPRVVEVTINGREEMFEIQTEIGISLVVNRSHKMRIYTDGEKQTIVVGDFIQGATTGKICHESGAVNFTIKSVGEDEFYGFQISDDHLYLDAHGFEHHNSIQAEELRGQLGEAMPAAFGIMAKSLGVTTQELDKMMASGNLIASEVLPKFAKEMENAYGANAQKMASGLSSEIARMGNKWDELLETVGRTGVIEGTVSLLTAGIEGLSASVAMLTLQWGEYQQAVINAERASQLDAEGKRIDAQIQKRIETLKKAGLTEDEINEELTASYNKYVEEVEAGDARIERSRKALFGGGIVITEESVRELELKRATRDILLESINALKDTGAVQAGNTKLSKEELKTIERTRKGREKAQKDIKDWLTAQAKIHLETRSGFTGPQQTREQAGMGMGIDERNKKEMQSQFEEAQTALEHSHKMGEKTEEQYLRAKLALYEKYGQDKRKVEEEIYAFEQGFAKERTKEVWTEAQSRVYATDKTLETLNMLNNAYTQSQTNQLQKQLEQGVISQEQYEQSLRKIKRRQAVIDKAGALFNIAINTAQGVSSAAGSVLGLPLAPVIGALGAIQAGIVLATPIPYNKGTKKVPMVRGAVRGKDSVHAILTPNERVVPEDINTQPGYSALMDLAHDRKISDKEAGFIAKLATGGVYAGQQSSDIDYNQLGKSIAKYIPHTDVRIDHNGIAVITDRSHANMNRLKTRL